MADTTWPEATHYLTAAEAAVALVADPAVETAWEAPSALSGLGVGDLAAHLASQVTGALESLDNPVSGPTVDLIGHYDRSRWLGQPLDSEINVAIREGSHAFASAGQGAVLDRVRGALETLRVRLPALTPDAVVQPSWLDWSLRLGDFLTVRQLEIVVHSDDLAVSVGLPTPELPDGVTTPVLALLTRLSARRHGVTAVVRALSRAERATATISGFS